jgi:putative redox protein
MQIQLVQVQGITFAAKGDSGHWVMIDGPAEFGGSLAAARPLELMLFSLAGCAGADVASMLAKRRIRLRRFEVAAAAEQAETYPKVFTSIHLTFVVHAENLRPAELERMIELTRTKYCPAWAMLQQAVPITYSFECPTDDE